jgi:hypothetical protein
MSLALPARESQASLFILYCASAFLIADSYASFENWRRCAALVIGVSLCAHNLLFLIL